MSLAPKTKSSQAIDLLRKLDYQGGQPHFDWQFKGFMKLCRDAKEQDPSLYELSLAIEKAEQGKIQDAVEQLELFVRNPICTSSDLFNATNVLMTLGAYHTLYELYGSIDPTGLDASEASLIALVNALAADVETTGRVVNYILKAYPCPDDIDLYARTNLRIASEIADYWQSHADDEFRKKVPLFWEVFQHSVAYRAPGHRMFFTDMVIDTMGDLELEGIGVSLAVAQGYLSDDDVYDLSDWLAEAMVDLDCDKSLKKHFFVDVMRRPARMEHVA